MEKQHYPKWIYHREQGSKIVQTKDEHLEHDKEWVEDPNQFLFEGAEARKKMEELFKKEKALADQKAAAFVKKAIK